MAKSFLLEMKNFDEFSALYLLVADKAANVALNLGIYGLVDPTKMQQNLMELHDKTIEFIKTIPFRMREKLFV